MTPATVNYISCVQGDTIPVRRLTITETINEVTTPVNLTDAIIKCDFVSGDVRESKTIGNGITLIDAADGVFEIDQFVLNIAGTYRWDIEIEFPGDVVKTWLRGELLITEQVTT